MLVSNLVANSKKEELRNVSVISGLADVGWYFGDYWDFF